MNDQPKVIDILQRADDDEVINELADRMELKADEREAFTDACMTRLGYTKKPTYHVPDSDDTSEGHQAVRNARARKRAASGSSQSGDDFYGINLGKRK